MSFPQKVRAKTRTLLKKVGLDVRFTSNHQQDRKRLAHEKTLNQWRFMTSYSPAMILDIGANAGQFAVIARELAPQAKIVSFEPLTECFEQLTKQKSQLEPIVMIQTALGANPGSVLMNRNASSPSSSLLPMNKRHYEELPHTELVMQEEVKVQRLDDFQSTFNIEVPLIIKIDVQGFTLPVLQGGVETIRQASIVIAEISTTQLYQGEASFDEIYHFMRHLNFDFTGNVDQWHSNLNGRVLQMDCIFENREIIKNQ